MANSDSRFGLRWVGSVGGGTSPILTPCYIAATYETALFKGDPVVRVTAGSNTAVERGTTLGDYDIGTLPSVGRATVTDNGVIDGVIVDFVPVTQDSVQYSPADTEGIALVCFDRQAIYEIQMDGALDPADVGFNAVGIYTHSGDTGTGWSGLELDSGTATAPSADASNPFTIESIVARVDNEPNAIYNKVLVRINNNNRADGRIGI